MSTEVMGNRGRWAISAAGGMVVLALLAALFSPPRIVPIATAPTATGPAVKFADSSPTNALSREATAMRDLAPLFLPTDRNATLERMPRREAGRTLFDAETQAPAFSEPELQFEKDLPAVVTLNGKSLMDAKPEDVLGANAALSSPSAGFGRTEVAVEPLKPRGGYLEVVAAATGSTVLGLTGPLPEAARPKTDKSWQPLQFLADVNAAGLVGPLILTERSGAEEVDQHYRNYLAQTFRIGERLPPGIYRITIGP